VLRGEERVRGGYKMKKIVVTVLCILIITLSMPGVGQAQNWIQIQGTIQAVDCQTNALVLNARDGMHAFPMTPDATVSINSAPASFCTLRQYVGSNATVTVAANGNQLVAGGVNVFVATAPAVPAPVAPPPVPGYGYYGPYYPYYGGPYCYGPYYYGAPYYGGPYCYGPYSGYYPYYGPSFGFGIGIGIVFGSGFRHDRDRDRRVVGTPRFHDGDRDRHFVGTPRFRDGNRDRRFIVVPGVHGRGGSRR
jgi:hypothetical protein